MKFAKKLTALALAAAVVLTICTFGAGAEFTDQSKIKHPEAVDVC